MAQSDNAEIQIESGQDLVAFKAMTTVDNTTFYTSDDIWSGKSGYAPVVRPNGIVTGRNLATPASAGGTDDVDVAAFTAYSKGVLHTVAGSEVTITRPATNVSKVNSLTMTDAGALAVVAGTDGSTTAFSETRGAAGGPPLIPVDSVELAQVRVSSSSAAVITADQIYQVVGTHTERADYPAITAINNVGMGLKAPVTGKQNAFVEFASANPVSHTGPIARKVWIKYYVPQLVAVARASDFKPVERSHSVSSAQHYGGAIASSSSSIGQGGFTVYLEDGITDDIVSQKDEILTVKFIQDKNKTPYSLTQGKIGLGRTFAATDQVQAAVTISSSVVTADFAS